MDLRHELPEDNLVLPEKVLNTDFLEAVEKGMKGQNVGLESSLKAINALNGLQEARYYLIGAHPNVGKTQFVDFAFVFHAWLTAKRLGKKIKIFYCSLELSAMEKKAKWCCTFLNWKHNLNWTPNFIMGRIPDKLPSESDYALIAEAYNYVDYMLQDVLMINQATDPESIYKYLVEHYYPNYGQVKRKPVTDKQRQKGIKGDVIGFDQALEMPLTLLVIDHLALLQGPDKKKTMDKMSEYGVFLRNTFKLSPVFVQQFNQELTRTRRDSLTRHGKGAHLQLEPKQIDFGDSTFTFRDADYVYGLIKPYSFDLDTYMDIPCEVPMQDSQGRAYGGLGDCLMAVYLVKNRYGRKDLAFPLFMNGIAGTFHELPFDVGEEWIELALKLTNG